MIVFKYVDVNGVNFWKSFSSLLRSGKLESDPCITLAIAAQSCQNKPGKLSQNVNV